MRVVRISLFNVFTMLHYNSLQITRDILFTVLKSIFIDHRIPNYYTHMTLPCKPNRRNIFRRKSRFASASDCFRTSSPCASLASAADLGIHIARTFARANHHRIQLASPGRSPNIVLIINKYQ